MPNPELEARKNIDEQLVKCGWTVQDKDRVDHTVSNALAIREYPTNTGPADYILFLNRKAVGVIEAKKEGEILSRHEDQTQRYAESELKWRVDDEPLPFLYESTGKVTHFRDNRDPKPRSRNVFTFHRPETFEAWLKNSESLRKRLTEFPKLEKGNLRDCQFDAINNLEKSLSENRPKALIQMSMGSGKTFTAITFIYRLLEYAKAQRVLFLVDTRNLGKQAEQEFQAYQPFNDKRKFPELYNIQRLSSGHLDKGCEVHISTIQRMYSILKGTDIDESAEEQSLFETLVLDNTPKEVTYNTEIPIGYYDMIVIDECHRSIYNLWKQVLDYFDAFQVGLTATPDARTFAFFNQNVVSEYSHEDAVIDGVNVGYDVYTIETKITQAGAKIKGEKKKKVDGEQMVFNQYVEARSKLDRKARWRQLDEDVEYTKKQLDRDIVNKSQIRTIIKTFKSRITTEIFHGREEVPKTLIFAKTDSHADDIIQIVREEFAEGNDFCKKVTYREDKPDEILQAFRTAYNPRIAVTVDMIATGTDVKPLEVLIFMRDVKSRNYFEQMKGRGTRTFSKDDLKRVTPSADTNKTHFVIIDAIGVCRSVKTDSRPLERKKSVSFRDLMQGIAMGQRDEDTIISTAGRLARLDRQLSEDEHAKVEKLTGAPLKEIVRGLLESYDPDVQAETARKRFNLDAETEPTKEQIAEVKEDLVNTACSVFDSSKVRELLEDMRRHDEQILDNENLDELVKAGFDEDAKANKDKLDALQFFYSQPYKNRITFKQVQELAEALQKPPLMLTTDKLWQAYEIIEKGKTSAKSKERLLTDIISLIRHAINPKDELMPFVEIVNTRFQGWLQKQGAKFSPEQIEWLTMIKDHIAASLSVVKADFDFAPFADHGGLQKVWGLFGSDLDSILAEMNKELVA